MKRISDEPLVSFLQKTIRISVRILAILMSFVIFFGVADIVWLIYQKLINSDPRFLLSISDILETFGAFMAVLIAIEIFINIIVYLRDEMIHVKIVLATALVAIARKVIVLDYDTTTPEYVWATAAAILGVGFVYWLIACRSHPKKKLRAKDMML